MTAASDPLEPGFVRLIHPDSGGIADVSPLALRTHFAGGWRRLVAGDVPEDAPPGEPAPMTEAQVRDGLASKQGGAAAQPKARGRAGNEE